LGRPEQIGKEHLGAIEIDGLGTVALAGLIEMKLHSDGKNFLRAQDLADGIGLLHQHKRRIRGSSR
jgi:hypothetical protein